MIFPDVYKEQRVALSRYCDYSQGTAPPIA